MNIIENTPNTNDFSVAKVGDRVWVRLLDYEGLATVTMVIQETVVYSMRVKLDTGAIVSFTLSGSFISNGPQCLFWDKPEIIAPPRPKRMVKKVVEVRPCLYRDEPVQYLKRADTIEGSNYKPNGPVQPVEILVEEE